MNKHLTYQNNKAYVISYSNKKRSGFDYAQPDRHSEHLSADKARSRIEGQIEFIVFY